MSTRLTVTRDSSLHMDKQDYLIRRADQPGVIATMRALPEHADLIIAVIDDLAAAESRVADLRTRIETLLTDCYVFRDIDGDLTCLDVTDERWDEAMYCLPCQIRAALDGDTQEEDLTEQGRLLASRRDDLITQGVDPADLAIPLAPRSARSRPPADTDTGRGQ